MLEKPLVALIAHDQKKEDMIQFVQTYRCLS